MRIEFCEETSQKTAEKETEDNIKTDCKEILYTEMY